MLIFWGQDFTEVDNNVTRHIDDELVRADWDGMVLHYLGLDHIGHKAGPRSPHMLPKQQEMDDIVRKIYTAIELHHHLESTLFVLAGDHGMNDAGNHGGSAPGETSPALLLMSPKFGKVFPGGMECPTPPREGEFDFYTTVEQSDVVPTLAGLLGFPVPKNNLGVFIPKFLELWDGMYLIYLSLIVKSQVTISDQRKVGDRVEIMLRNARQLLEIVRAAYPDFGNKGVLEDCSAASVDVDELACWWGKALEANKNSLGSGVDHTVTLDLLYKFSTRCQDFLSMAASNYNLNWMSAGVAVTLLALVLSVFSFVPLLESSKLANTFFPAITLAYGIMMFASSYVEEEHHFWYWVASGWFIAIYIKGYIIFTCRPDRITNNIPGIEKSVHYRL